MQDFLEHRETGLLVGLDCCAHEHADATHMLGLLCAGNKRPGPRAAKECYELAPPHCLPKAPNAASY
jgi:hypothetical protein